MIKKNNIGVIGIGKLGKFHIDKLNKISGCNFVGAFDLDLDLVNKYSIKNFLTINELFDECDSVIISTPTSTHYSIAKQALNLGLNVFIEKPITDNLIDAEDLAVIAKENNKIIQVGHIERFNKVFIESLKYIKDPQFIEIHRISPFPNRSLDIDVVMDLMIHDLDILISMNLNNKIIDIKASGASVITDYIDLANARIQFEDGLVANLTASRISAKQMRKIRVFQNKSYLGIDLFEKKLDLYKINHEENDLIENKKIEIEDSDALELELIHFIDCINNNRKPIVSDRDAIKALKLALKIKELINESGKI
ncbi:MAG: hypothetical protein CBD97_01185 [Pelagibacteraceae bacterium TMED237]|nr:oxidoreductase [Candidatus Neomarinimicrobiota bacterium]OUW96608.1 MAG: hypothetical protein CBD97_01185 [Pelagibacteraceae bacterium TMED237]|tara:strand:- start:3389 stop:4318 length:930 start_codon:yes stop_codon:yes gene_type:complete